MDCVLLVCSTNRDLTRVDPINPYKTPWEAPDAAVGALLPQHSEHATVVLCASFQTRASITGSSY